MHSGPSLKMALHKMERSGALRLQNAHSLGVEFPQPVRDRAGIEVVAVSAWGANGSGESAWNNRDSNEFWGHNTRPFFIM